MKHKPTIYSVIPNYSRNDGYHQDWKDEQEEMALAVTKAEEFESRTLKKKAFHLYSADQVTIESGEKNGMRITIKISAIYWAHIIRISFYQKR